MSRHPGNEDLSPGTPEPRHPNDVDLSLGTPEPRHPSDVDLSLGTPEPRHPSDVDLSLGTPESPRAHLKFAVNLSAPRATAAATSMTPIAPPSSVRARARDTSFNGSTTTFSKTQPS